MEEKINLRVTYALRSRVLYCQIFQIGEQTPDKQWSIKKLLENPNLQKWNPKELCFDEATTTAIKNNQFLADYIKPYREAIEKYNPATAVELVNIVAGKECKEKTPTFEKYLNEFIKKKMNPQSKNPATSFRAYNNLLHKLTEARSRTDKYQYDFLNIPLTHITDEVYIKFCDYLKYALNGVNLIPLAGCFKTVFNDAYNNKIVSYRLTYVAKRNQRKDNTKELEKKTRKKALTENQLQQFKNMDLTPFLKQRESIQQLELYRDFCLLLYGLSARPIDVATMQRRYIDDESKTIYYAITKKKNNDDAPNCRAIITPLAAQIIDKYKDSHHAGYLLPLVMYKSQTEAYKLSDPSVFYKFYNCWNGKCLYKINNFLHRITDALGFKENLTTYTFRHTAITHQINKKAVILKVAINAGTSLKHIQETYYDPMHNDVGFNNWCNSL